MNNQPAKTQSPNQVRQVRQALLREFSELIDLSNVETSRPEEVEKQLLSRSLAALAVRKLTGCSSQVAAETVIDGRHDQGIDAVALADGTSEVFLVQAKWSERGTAGIDTAAAHKMVAGFRQIEDRRFERFNARFQAMAEKLRAVLAEPHLRVTLVQAVMGDGRLAPEVTQVFEDACTEFNGHGRYLHYKVLSSADFHQQVRDDLSEIPISLKINMSQWIHRDLPADAYQGSVAADGVAQWFAEFGDRLFEQNVRKSLGLTTVNQAMVDTLVNDPMSFWSRNNGITVLCSEIQTSYPSGRRPNLPVDLHLSGVSVVNGAQTVTAIHEAFRKAPEAVQDADVSVRVIQVPADDAVFGGVVTRSTNTQNHMERRDFIALDEVQMAIREDFALSLDKTYVFKRGDIDPAPDAGCSVVTAAIALACAHRNPEFVFRAKRDRDLLWEVDRGGAYPSLFGNQPSAGLIWHSVQLFREINRVLRREGKKLEGRASTIVDHGDLMLTHLVFQAIDAEGIEDADSDWRIPANLDELVVAAIRWLIHEVDSAYGATSFVTSTFAKHERFLELAKRVHARLDSGEPAPEIGAEYHPAPRPAKGRARTAVSVLIDANRIDQGETLHFVPSTEREQAAIGGWLVQNSRRSLATWVTDRRKPLLWAGDGQRYSPSGLVMHIWQEAGWDEAPVAVQGPKCWHLGREGSLVELANALRRDDERE